MYSEAPGFIFFAPPPPFVAQRLGQKSPTWWEKSQLVTIKKSAELSRVLALMGTIILRGDSKAYVRRRQEEGSKKVETLFGGMEERESEEGEKIYSVKQASHSLFPPTFLPLSLSLPLSPPSLSLSLTNQLFGLTRARMGGREKSGGKSRKRCQKPFVDFFTQARGNGKPFCKYI